jgi:16S rRNA (uracil1498-N3)-methyltransferase
MKEERYFYVPQAVTMGELPQEEAIHAVRVLRLSAGDELFLMDGVGNFYKAEVTLATQKRCMYEIRETMPQEAAWSGNIHLAIAPTKDMGRMEWMAEKATEVGFDALSFLSCKFSERKVIRHERIDKIVVSAMKQSRKAWKPEVSDMISFKDFVTQPRDGRKYICHCYNEIERKDFFSEIQRHDENITMMVGPEGDFSIDEVRMAMENGYESVTLGNSRLRTETAGLQAVMMAQIARRK